MINDDSIVSSEESIKNIIMDSDSTSFNKDVIEASNDIPILVDFWADWCAPCKQLTPILESAVKDYKGEIRLVKIDTEKNPELSKQLQIQSYLNPAQQYESSLDLWYLQHFGLYQHLKHSFHVMLLMLRLVIQYILIL